jgi:hypothetical protein
MRRSQLICLTLVFTGLLASQSAAQTTAPVQGGIAAGADIGVFFPDTIFEKTFTIDGYGEYYVLPHVSIRGMLGWASPGFENLTEDHFRQVRLLFNGVYYWKRDNLLPFVTAGAGAYFVRQLVTGVDPDSETRGGLNLGGGLEYLLGGGGAVRGEVRWDLVSEPPGLPDASGLTVTMGYKRYF